MRLLIALILYAGLAAAFAEDNPLTGASPIEIAIRHFQDGDLERALARLDQLDKVAAPTAESLDLRGCIYMEQGKFDEAKKAFDAAYTAHPTLFMPRLHLGDLLLRRKKWEEARGVYEAVMKNCKSQMLNERFRFAVLITYLGAQDEAGAKRALAQLVFPTETPSYYYAQAAWAFAHGEKREGRRWLRTAARIYDERRTAWFARPFYEMKWIKNKPPPVSD